MRQFSFHGPPRPHGRSKRLSNRTQRIGPLHMPLHRCGAGTQSSPAVPPVNLGQLQDRTAFDMRLRRVGPIGRSRSSHCYARVRSYGAADASTVAAQRSTAHVAFAAQSASAEHKQTANTCSYVSSVDHCPWLARCISPVPDPQFRTADCAHLVTLLSFTWKVLRDCGRNVSHLASWDSKGPEDLDSGRRMCKWGNLQEPPFRSKVSPSKGG